MDTLYQEHILDHYHNPRHSQPLPDSTHSADATNPSCGDTMTISLHIKGSVILDSAFMGEGCAISQAAASMLTEYITGKSIDTLMAMDADAMLKILEIPLSPGRIKCGLLALQTAQKACRTKSNV